MGVDEGALGSAAPGAGGMDSRSLGGTSERVGVGGRTLERVVSGACARENSSDRLFRCAYPSRGMRRGRRENVSVPNASGRRCPEPRRDMRAG